jgi:hypothetical protein
VYGILRPAATWNPIRICFQHIWLLIKDAWHAGSVWDKLRIWFMPTGWRPADVKRISPVPRIRDVYRFEKYDPQHHRLLPAWSGVQLGITLLLLGYLFANAAGIGIPSVYVYGGFILLSVFCFTELMDRSRFAVMGEAAKSLFGILWIILTGDWFGVGQHAPFAKYVIMAYFAVSPLVVACFTVNIWKGDKVLNRSEVIAQKPG